MREKRSANEIEKMFELEGHKKQTLEELEGEVITEFKNKFGNDFNKNKISEFIKDIFNTKRIK